MGSSVGLQPESCRSAPLSTSRPIGRFLRGTVEAHLALGHRLAAAALASVGFGGAISGFRQGLALAGADNFGSCVHTLIKKILFKGVYTPTQRLSYGCPTPSHHGNDRRHGYRLVARLQVADRVGEAREGRLVTVS